MEHPSAGALAGPDDDARLREDGARIEQLIEAVRRQAGPTIAPLVEELVQRLVGLYGAGLERVLGHAANAGALRGGFEQALCDDELVSSLLLLHGLHPLPVETRIQRALDRVRPYLGSHAGGVELVAVDGERVRLRLSGTCRSCASSRVTIEQALRGAIEEAAPEMVQIEVETDDDGLVQLRVGESPAGAWRALPDDPARGLHAIELDGENLLVIEHQGATLAYQNRCPECGSRLEDGELEGVELGCPGCGARFDVVHAGRPMDGEGAGLVPVPLRNRGASIEVALGEVHP